MFVMGMTYLTVTSLTCSTSRLVALNKRYTRGWCNVT